RIFQPNVAVGDTTSLRGAVINLGSDTLLLTRNSTLEINYSIDQGPTQTAKLYDDSLNFVFAPNDTIEFTHDIETVFPVEKVYSICMWPGNFTDQDISNDTLCVFVGLGSFTSISSSDVLQAIKLYPQPANERVYIQTSTGTQVKKWEIYTLQGKRIRSGEELGQSLSIKDLPAGIYHFRIETQKGRFNQKLVKQ
ncbi:MAG: T9SS type A sorting domain-containing protein, partial [Bacteroidota bacterium]